MKVNKQFYLLIFAVLLWTLGILPFVLPEKDEAVADTVFCVTEEECSEEEASSLQVIEKTTLLPLASPPKYTEIDIKQKVNVIVTAYSSTVWETQGDPFITASGNRVRVGIVANNMLPFGTKIQLPEIAGDTTFEVQDRMHWRKGNYHVDIWFPSREEALQFGTKYATMLVMAED